MKSKLSISCLPSAPRRWTRAFSLIEVLVVTALLSVIILGLVLMFGQTQRAYRLGTTQVDVLEGGRMVTDLMTREFSQMTPSDLPVWSGTTNFYNVVLPAPYQALDQPLPAPGTTLYRTNVLQDIFFLTRENQTWRGIGYVVRTNQHRGGFLGLPPAGMGTLYRFEQEITEAQARNLPATFDSFGDFLSRAFVIATQNETNLGVSKMLDGVVHFTVRTYDPEGRWINFNHPNVYGFEMVYPTNQFHPTRWVTNSVQLFSFASGMSRFGEIGSAFQSNAVPAAVEVEIGVLESREIERARSITDPTAQANFLAQQAGKVHIFRWRVPVRNFDPAAYQ